MHMDRRKESKLTDSDTIKVDLALKAGAEYELKV